MSDATTTVTSNGSYVVGIDNNNTETDRWWSVQKDGATELARIQEDGKMGIGNAAPIGLLHVGAGADTAVTTAANILGYFTRAGTSAIIARDATNDSEAVMIAGTGLVVFGSATNDPVIFRANNAEKMRLTAAGNLGVGNTAPTELFVVGAGGDASDVSEALAMITAAGAAALTVRDATNDVEAMILANSGGAHFGTYTNHNLFFDTNNTTRLYVGNDGKVGVGVTSPGGKLHVGAGFDTPTLSGVPTIYATELGQTTIVIRDSTDNIEAALIAGVSLVNFGTITNHDLAFLAQSVEAARIKADGKFGVGTTAPASILHAAQSNNGADTLLTVENTYSSSGSVDEGAGVEFRHNGFGGAKIVSGKIGDFTVSGNASGNVQIHTRNAGTWYERMRVGYDGNVGIGTTSPAYALAVEREGGTGAQIQVAGYGNTVEPAIRFYGPRGTQASPAANQAGDVLGALYFDGWDTARSTGAKIYAKTFDNWGSAGDSSDSPADLWFATVANGSDALTDRMVIKSDGVISLGNTNPPPITQAQVVIGNGDLYLDVAELWLPIVAVGERARAAVFADQSPLSVAFVASDATTGMEQFDITINDGTFYQNHGGYTPHVFQAGENELFRAYHVFEEGADREILQVPDKLFVLNGEDLPSDIWAGLPGAIALIGDHFVSWHDTSTGLYTFEIHPNKMYIYDEFIISDGELQQMLRIAPEDKRIGLFTNAAPQNPLHMSIFPISGGSTIGFFIVSGVFMSGAGAYTFLDGTSGVSLVGQCFKGHAVVNRAGGSTVMVDLAVTTGASQVVTPDTGESITFSINSNQLQVQRTAGSSSYHVTLYGLAF